MTNVTWSLTVNVLNVRIRAKIEKCLCCSLIVKNYGDMKRSSSFKISTINYCCWFTILLLTRNWFYSFLSWSRQLIYQNHLMFHVLVTFIDISRKLPFLIFLYRILWCWPCYLRVCFTFHENSLYHFWIICHTRIVETRSSKIINLLENCIWCC